MTGRERLGRIGVRRGYEQVQSVITILWIGKFTCRVKLE